MAEQRLRVDLFCEDGAHEDCGRAIIGRCARDSGVAVTTTARNARAGLPRVKSEFRLFQRTVIRGGGTVPDLLVVLADANDVGTAERRRELEAVIDNAVFPAVVVGTPDPYVERWLLADPVSFAARFGVQPDLRIGSGREAWKTRLEHALGEAGEFVIHGGAEFATEIFDVMDFYGAGHQAPELRTFTDELRAAFRLLTQDA